MREKWTETQRKTEGQLVTAYITYGGESSKLKLCAFMQVWCKPISKCFENRHKSYTQTVSCHCTERHEQKPNNNLKFENYDRKRTN